MTQILESNACSISWSLFARFQTISDVLFYIWGQFQIDQLGLSSNFAIVFFWILLQKRGVTTTQVVALFGIPRKHGGTDGMHESLVVGIGTRPPGMKSVWAEGGTQLIQGNSGFSSVKRDCLRPAKASQHWSKKDRAAQRSGFGTCAGKLYTNAFHRDP